MIPRRQLSTLGSGATPHLSWLDPAAALAVLALVVSNAAGGQNPTRKLTVSVLEQRAQCPKVVAAAAYDTKRNRMLVFGGSVRNDNAAAGQLLSLDLQTERWDVVTVDGPTPRGTSSPALAYVEDEDALYLFGGWPKGADKPLAELWILELASRDPLRWQLVSDGSHGPSPRNGCCMVADAKRKRLIVHGGDGGPHPEYGYTPLDDLWAFDLAGRSWHELKPSGDVPKPRWNHAAAMDQGNGVIFVFGGADYVGATPVLDREAYELNLETLNWARLPAHGTIPPPVEGTSLTHDSRCGVLLVVGGMPLSLWGKGGSRSVWSLDLATRVWVEHEDVLPTTRRDHVAVYDPVGRRHIVFGGDTVTGQDFYSRGTELTDAVAITVAESGTK